MIEKQQETVQRYQIEIGSGDWGAYLIPTVVDNGEWVKHSDHERIVKGLEEKLRQHKSTYDTNLKTLEHNHNLEMRDQELILREVGAQRDAALEAINKVPDVFKGSYSAISTRGVNVYGDKNSIDEVKWWLHSYDIAAKRQEAWKNRLDAALEANKPLYVAFIDEIPSISTQPHEICEPESLTSAQLEQYWAGLKKRCEQAEEANKTLQGELDKCGKEYCMGHSVDGCRRWVSEEALTRCEAERDAAIQRAEVAEDMLRTVVNDDLDLGYRLRQGRAYLALMAEKEGA